LCLHCVAYYFPHVCFSELEDQCWCFIDSEEIFTEDTAFLLYLDAGKHKNKIVKKKMIPRINKYFLALVSTENFLELPVDSLSALLRSSNICVHR
jgi:hypothetical protein